MSFISSSSISAFFLSSGLGLVVLSKTPSWLLAANTLTYILAFGEFSFGPDIITDPPGATYCSTSSSDEHSFDGESRRAAACGRAELLANFFGGAVWGNFRENANCGDPPG